MFATRRHPVNSARYYRHWPRQLSVLPAPAGGRRAAAPYSLIESAKLNGLNPQHYLADVLARIADHPTRIGELLPGNWQPLDATKAAA